MAVTAKNRIVVEFSEDVIATFPYNAADNEDSPGVVQLLSLVNGANTITLPTGGSTVVGAVIIPPGGNAQTITLKGVSGDTGIALHKTNPTQITFDTTPPTDFILTTNGTITGLRIVWF